MLLTARDEATSRFVCAAARGFASQEFTTPGDPDAAPGPYEDARAGFRAGDTPHVPQRFQFSNPNPATRLNSLSLSVTTTAPRARACAAIHRSLAPMGMPWRSSAARIRP